MENNDTLYILWTNPDLITFEKMVCMYAFNSIKKEWWNNVTVVIWGGTSKLVYEQELAQKKIKECIEGGVRFSACKACADQLGVTDLLESLGVEVKYWGPPLTELIKNNSYLITI